jgi:hypothetical protein
MKWFRRKKNIIITCLEHGAITNLIGRHEISACIQRHRNAGCSQKVWILEGELKWVNTKNDKRRRNK